MPKALWWSLGQCLWRAQKEFPADEKCARIIKAYPKGHEELIRVLKIARSWPRREELVIKELSLPS